MSDIQFSFLGRDGKADEATRGYTRRLLCGILDPAFGDRKRKTIGRTWELAQMICNLLTRPIIFQYHMQLADPN